MRVVVTGAEGMLGSDLLPKLKGEYDVIPFGREALDISDSDLVYRTISSVRPDILINCAAFTNVDLAEVQRERAFAVNGLGVFNLVKACSDFKIILCHVSTDYVFAGIGERPYSPFDPTAPINFYGGSKLAGEKYIQWFMKEYFIIRTSWLYGLRGNNFVKTILGLSRENEEIRVVSDQTGSPTWTENLAAGIRKVIESGVFGIHHVTDRTDGGISWYDFATEIVRLSGLGTRVVPVSTADFPTEARRPAYSVLDTFYTEVATGFKPLDWRASLSGFLEDYGRAALNLKKNRGKL
ncbi:dTDP-4-dehydrorhamnose reductase [bacterium BMS3Bbin06]|nr:dTDP-4-dehydrorhamnose reductase [bacterium BMS3Abin08]GBE34987.1 dTDP-4-dehydrorhamnose reductase [bacterium BMS3Bbin06]HDO35249.1 dTDP-4-dehydrorhamnose reductase [Nitrospirota bacterium]HDY70703.1 dTDP-4-dehydrorhamnose reductase [Nitrospirota bacterium]